MTLYLFGSQARGKTGPLSDYDFAVQSVPGLSAAKRFHLKLQLMDRLSRILRTDAVDVVLLEDASPLLAHRVLKDARIVFCRNQKSRIRSEFHTLTSYLDFSDDLQFYAQATLGLPPSGVVHG